MTAPRAALVAALREALGPAEEPLGLAVSGGGDSVALLCLAVEAGLPVRAVTVDHGLREGSAAEAEWVAALCARLGVPHRALRWTGWDRAGNLQDMARRARLSLMADWARDEGIRRIALGHTRDDQAETLLLRLARRAGADGLAAMAPRRMFLGIEWCRPLLGVGRAELREYLVPRGQGWIDDPSNEALRFDRVKARKALVALEQLGLGPGVLAEVAAQMAEVRAALGVQTGAAARTIVEVDRGDVVIERDGFLALPAEIARRLLVAALVWVGSAEYGPRADAVQRLMRALAAGQGGTLAGCRVLCRAGGVRVVREARAVAATVAEPGALWDGRWRLASRISGLQVRVLGAAGLSLCPAWRDTGLPRATLLASPALWRDDALIAAPLAGLLADGVSLAAPEAEGFFLSVLSH